MAPHQDDELILCGGFMNSLIEQEYQIYVVFMTNGDYEPDIGKVRLSEALMVLKEFGLPEGHIIFMGYANEYDASGPHIYNAAKGQTVRSQYGNCQTYGLESHSEYCFRKYGIHHLYQRINLVSDLFEILQEIRPDIIFSTDAEIHPDHKANSLFLDEVLGRILQEAPDYSPVVLKKPEYSTSWFNPEDYTKYNNKASLLGFRVKVNGEDSDFDNPYIRWEGRTRLPIDLSVQNPLLKENSLWKALNQYKSQNAAAHYGQMTNSDVTFWARRTDSLTYRSYIETSSGNRDFLNDFKIFDSLDIKRTPLDAWNIGASVWHPEDSDASPTVKINWREKKKISSVVFYQEFCPDAEIIKSHILLDDGKVLTVGRLHKRKPTVVFLDSAYISGFQFVIDEWSNPAALPGLSEIEVYEEKKIPYAYIKLLIDGNFVYRYLTFKKAGGRLGIYLTDEAGMPGYAGFNQVDIKITDLYGRSLPTEDYLDKQGRLYRELDQDIRIQVSLKSQPQLSDTVLLFRNQWKERKYWYFVRLLRQITIPFKDIRGMETSTGFEKLNYIRSFYKIAQVKRQYGLCVYLKTFYLQYQSGCRRRKQLDDYQEAEGSAFLMLGECMPDGSQWAKKYFRGRRADIVKPTGKRIYFIGTPSHYNLGDHVIAFAIKEYLQKVLPDAPITEVSIQEFPYMLGIMKRTIGRDDLIILQGGGNMGNIYWTNERIRREVIRHFPDNHIIIFPETIYYENTVYGNADLAESINIYRKAKHLTICAREKVSYQTMKGYYTHADVILTPDIACSYKFKIPKIRNGTVKLFFRSDRESCIDSGMQKITEQILDGMGQPYMFSDMMYQSKGYIGRANRNYIVEQKVREISEAKLVVTDRLHAMILSVLTGTPCLVFYGYNHKIESTFRTWFHEIPYIALLENPAQLADGMERVMKAAEQKEAVQNWDKAFSPLEEAIKEAWI